jgi:predicted acetyltransferase
MSSDNDITIETATPEDWDEVYTMFSGALNFDGDPSNPAAGLEFAAWEPERSQVVRRGGKIVGTMSTNTRRIAVPGAVVNAAHGGRGAVALTARHQGILRSLIHRHLTEAKEHGEGITVCWASEARIYQRFGFGLGIRRVGVNVNTREAEIPDASTANLIEGSPAEVRKDLVAVYDRVQRTQPGWSERSANNWDYRLADFPWMRDGATSLRAILHEGPDGEIDGYALWAATGAWEETGPTGQVKVLEVVTETSQAYTSLWKFLTSVELTRTVQVWACGLDEPLFFWLGEPRQMNTNPICDGIWVRVVDVPKALSQRRYAAPVDLVIEVEDTVLPENSGNYRLVGSADAATCEPTTDAADLICNVRALGAAYMGGSKLTALATAGLVREVTPGALAKASAAFGWHQAPSAFEIF